jgi:thiol:disulfide interchange protein DsbD
MFKTVTYFCLLPALILSTLGHAASVKTDYATVELLAENDAIVAGSTFDVAVHFELVEHWHIYWANPGASGVAPQLDWMLPEGFEAGSIQWPVPERIEMAGLINYGYENEATLIIPMTAPERLKPGTEITLAADLFFLICKDLCLPGNAGLELTLPVADLVKPGANAALFEAARASQPEPSADWSVAGRVDGETLMLLMEGGNIPADLYFYAASEGVVDPSAEQILSYPAVDRVELRLSADPVFLADPLDSISGLLRSGADAWAIEVQIGDAPPQVRSAVEPRTATAMAAPEPVGFEQRLLALGLPGFLTLAFLGGLILNIMPCVLPVLSLKVFSLLKHAGQTRVDALKHGLAYTVGVVLSFLLLAGVLLVLRSFGERIGWGFQLQSPGFIVVLTAVFFLFGLNLMGVFELGGRLVGADTQLAQRKDLFGSFGMGILAAVVGAPCIGPLVAGVSGVAVQTNAGTGLLIFGTMGLGLASPFLLLSVFPKLIAFLPKPGLWMESFKQGMGFLLMAAVVFLALVAGRQGGVDAIIVSLALMLSLAVAAWIFGRWGAALRSKRVQMTARLAASVLVLSSIAWAISETKAAYANTDAAPVEGSSEQWQPWSAERVESILAEGRPVFVDFTATWCLICQVNKRVALRTEATKQLFEEYNVVALSADWTRYDPKITSALESFDRLGVPLYVLYTPHGEMSVLPQSLTNGLVRDAVEKALGTDTGMHSKSY